MGLQMFQDITEKIVSPELPAQELAEAMGELVEYVGGLLDTKRDDPRDDMLGRTGRVLGGRRDIQG